MNPNIIQFFWQFHKKYKIRLYLFCLCSSWVGIYGIANSYLIKLLIDKLSFHPNMDISHTKLLLIAGFLVINIMMLNIAWRFIGFVKLNIVPSVRNEMTELLIQHVFKLPRQYIDNTLTGTISNNIFLLIDSIERLSSILSVRIIKGFFQWILTLVLMYLVHPIFSLGLFCWTLIFFLFSWRYSKKLQQYGDKYAYHFSQVVGEAVDVITNSLSVLLFSRTDYEANRRKYVLDKMKKTYQKKEWFLMSFNFIQGTSIALLISFVCYWLILLYIRGSITLGDFALILGSTFIVTETVWSFLEQTDEINELIGKIKQCMRNILKPAKSTEVLKKLKISLGIIEFKGVNFRYDSKEPLFNNLTFKISSKEQVGIVGYSGAGKSTLIKLIIGLYDTQKGSILIDGQSVNTMNSHSLHNQITYIPQEPALFHRTIFENIKYANIKATKEEVIEASKKACLHQKIIKLPLGYKTVIGENGFKLSSGERQRIGLARAFLKKSSILILDEPTSQLDVMTEKAIETSLQELMKGKTTILIAHRLSNLKKMERIIVLDKGNIVEEGPPKDLYQNGGYFRSFWDLQTGGVPYGNT